VLQNVVKTLALTALANDVTADDVNRVAREFSLGPREQATTEVGFRWILPLRMHASSSRSNTSCTISGARKATCRAWPIASGLERTHLYRKLKQLGIRPSGKSEDAAGG
jgi:transcriptional regulator of acetoin/glycerol metabolism